jgi:hypothetical protein
MAKFRATVRVTEIEGPDLANVQRALDERMKEAGFAKWRVLSIETEGAPPTISRRRETRGPARRTRRNEGWGLFFVAAGAWAVWFFWLLVD